MTERIRRRVGTNTLTRRTGEPLMLCAIPKVQTRLQRRLHRGSDFRWSQHSLSAFAAPRTRRDNRPMIGGRSPEGIRVLRMVLEEGPGSVGQEAWG